MGQIFDDIFRTLCEKNSKLLIPLINEVFHKNYPMTEKIELWAGEHHVLAEDSKSLDKRITDSAIHIGEKLYHLECQSNPDGSMVLRMVEYDFHIALENAVEMATGYEMQFPESAVLYLRHSENTPDEIQMKITFPQNHSVTYSVPVIKTQLYSEEDIIGKQLYFLIPYYILKYEHISDTEDLTEISQEYRKLYQGMTDAKEAGLLNEYDMSNIVDFTNKLVEYVFREQETIRNEVNAVMGGEVLETYADRMIAKGIEQGMIQGIEQGMEQGMIQGIEQGMAQGSIRTTIKMAREFGVPDDKLIERLMNEFSMDREEAERACREI